MAGRRRQRRAAQDHLVDHEFAVVFAERARRRPVARIWRIGAARPLPDDAEGVAEHAAFGRDLPLGFGRQILAGPARERVGLVIADVTDRRARIDRAQAAERHREPCAVDLAPIAGRVPALRLDRRPAVGQPQRRRRVAAVGHEFEPLAVGHERRREPHRPQQRPDAPAVRCRNRSRRRRDRS